MTYAEDVRRRPIPVTSAAPFSSTFLEFERVSVPSPREFPDERDIVYVTAGEFEWIENHQGVPLTRTVLRYRARSHVPPVHGLRYDSALDRKEIAKRIRRDIALMLEASEIPDAKYNVRCDSVNRISCHVSNVSFPIFEAKGRNYKYSKDACQLLDKLQDVLNAYVGYSEDETPNFKAWVDFDPTYKDDQRSKMR